MHEQEKANEWTKDNGPNKDRPAQLPRLGHVQQYMCRPRSAKHISISDKA
jgi:hypothetical protein